MASINLLALPAKIYIIAVLCALSYFFLVARGPVPKYFSVLTPIAAVLALVGISFELHARATAHPEKAHGLEHDFPRGPHRPQGINWL